MSHLHAILSIANVLIGCKSMDSWRNFSEIKVMSVLCHFLCIMFYFSIQKQNSVVSYPRQNSLELATNQNERSRALIPHKLQFGFYNQLSPFIPVEISVKKEVSSEAAFTSEEVTEAPNETPNKDLTNIIDNLFEPHIPLPSDEEYFPFINESYSANCTQTNSTSSCQESILNAPVLDETTIAKSVVLSFIAIFSYTGNIATITSILRTGRQNTSTVYMLLVQLTIADLLVTTFCILTDAIWMLTVQWYGGEFLCKMVKFMQMFSLYLSTFVLVLIGFDRLCAVRFPMARARAKKDVRKGIVCIWTLSALFSSPQVSYTKLYCIWWKVHSFFFFKQNWYLKLFKADKFIEFLLTHWYFIKTLKSVWIIAFQTVFSFPCMISYYRSLRNFDQKLGNFTLN